MYVQIGKTQDGEEIKCLSCEEVVDMVHPQCRPNTGNCKNCANFMYLRQ